MEGGWNFSFNIYVKKMCYALVKRKRKVNPFKIIKDYRVIGNIEKLYKNNQINKTIYNLWKANK